MGRAQLKAKHFLRGAFWEECAGENDLEGRRRCIFFLTFCPNNLIYESRCDLFGSPNLDVKGESTDEERNQESCSEEEEVAREFKQLKQDLAEAPMFRGLFHFGQPF